MTCPATTGEDALVERIRCILSYNDGSSVDIFLNYSILILNLIVAAIPIIYLNFCCYHHRHHRHDNNNQSAGLILGFRAFLSLLFAIVFQIGLCSAVQCFGISVVWCSVFGWILAGSVDIKNYCCCLNYCRKIINFIPSSSSSSNTAAAQTVTETKLYQRIVILISLIDCGTILFYVITAEPITTVAHM